MDRTEVEQLGRLCEIFFFFPLLYTYFGLLFSLSYPMLLSHVACHCAPTGQSVDTPKLQDIFQHQPVPQSLPFSLPAHFNSDFFCDLIFDHPQIVLDDRCCLIPLHITFRLPQPSELTLRYFQSHHNAVVHLLQCFT